MSNTPQIKISTVIVDDYGEIVETEPAPLTGEVNQQINVDQKVSLKTLPGLKSSHLSGKYISNLLLWWTSLCVAVVLLVVGGLMWFGGMVQQAEVAKTSSDQKPATSLLNIVLTLEQQKEFEDAYVLAQQLFNEDKPDQAAQILANIVKTDPNFAHDAVAFLFICYRAAALDQMRQSSTDQQASNSFLTALALLNQYPDILRAQFKEKPYLLQSAYQNFDEMVNDLIQLKDLFALYQNGDAQDKDLDPTWFDKALPSWVKLYDENKEFLYFKEDTSRWIVTRLLEAYQAKSVYYCNVKNNFSVANSTLNQAIKLTQENNLEHQLIDLQRQAQDYKTSQCNYQG